MKLIDRMNRLPLAVSFGRRGGGGGAGTATLGIAPQADHVAIDAGGAPALFPPADFVNAGVMSAADKVKLDGLFSASILPPAPPGEYETIAQVQQTGIEPTVNLVRVGGYNAPGDGGSGHYIRVPSQPAHGGAFQSADGAWWELTERVVTPEMYGALGNGVANDTAAMMAMGNHARIRGFLDCVLAANKTYNYTIPQFLNNIPKIVIEGNGSAFRNIAGGATDTTFAENLIGLNFAIAFYTNGPSWYLGSASPYNFGQKIETAAAASYTVTVQPAEGAPAVAPGTRVLIYGFDAQSTASFPPNARFFEYATVTAVNGQMVTLDTPLAYGYDSAWPETFASSLYGKPRILPLARADFREIDSLHLRNLRILANPAWTAPLGTAERNGRLSVGGCRYALIENVEVAGSFYALQSETMHVIGGNVAQTTEPDKLIGRLRFENWRTKKHILATGVRTLEMINCRIHDGLNASPQDHLLIDGGVIRGKSDGSSAALLVLNQGCKRITVRGGARFNVDEASRVAFFNNTLRSGAVTVVNASTLEMTLAAYTTSQFARVMGLGTRFYDASGAPALRITRLPYESGGNVRFEGAFFKTIVTGDTLHGSLFEEIDIRGAIFDGAFGHQIRAMPLTAIVTPVPVKIASPRHGDGFWIITSDDADAALATTRYFNPGFRVSVTRVVIDVIKPYTGASTYSQLLFREHLGTPNPWASINLKIAGRRVLDLAGVAGAQANDTLTGLGANPVTIFNYQGSPGGAVASAGEAAVWSIRIEGSQI